MYRKTIFGNNACLCCHERIRAVKEFQRNVSSSHKEQSKKIAGRIFEALIGDQSKKHDDENDNNVP